MNFIFHGNLTILIQIYCCFSLKGFKTEFEILHDLRLKSNSHLFLQLASRLALPYIITSCKYFIALAWAGQGSVQVYRLHLYTCTQDRTDTYAVHAVYHHMQSPCGWEGRSLHTRFPPPFTLNTPVKFYHSRTVAYSEQHFLFQVNPHY